MGDHPIDECIAQANKIALAGHTVYQKFTCSHCGVRVQMQEPNTFYRSGECCVCGKETDIEASGCNYAVFMQGPITVEEALAKLAATWGKE